MNSTPVRSLLIACIMTCTVAAASASPVNATEACLAPFAEDTHVFSPTDGEADVPVNATPLVQRGGARGSFSLRVGGALVPFHEDVADIARGEQHSGDALSRIIPDVPFPPQSEVELQLDGERLVTFTVGTARDDEPPDAPGLATAAPSQSGRLCPGMAVLTVEHPAGSRVVIAGANHRPVLSQGIDGLTRADTLVVASSPGNEIPVFAAALDVAGNLSGVARLDDVSFEAEIGPVQPGCAQSGNATWLGAVLAVPLARRAINRKRRVGPGCSNNVDSDARARALR